MSAAARAGAGRADTAGTPSAAAWHSPFNPWLTAIVATLATFMEVLDTSIANVALPHIAGSLGAGVEDSTWVLTSYLVSNAIVLPISAWASSLMGRKNFYMFCVALFTLSSLMCGLAPNLGLLVFFRLLQGLGGGGLQPSTQAILVDTFPPRQRGMGMAVYGMTVVVAPVIGPTLGGWITDNFSWRWIFFINLPVGLVSLLLASRIISDPPYLPRRFGPDRFRVDYIGLGLLTIGLGALQITLDLGERRDWFASTSIILWASVAAAAILSVIVWELRHRDPIVQLRLLADRNLGFSVFTMVVFGFVLLGSTVLLPLFMQTVLGYTATLSGLALSPGGLVVMVLMPLVGFLVTRIDPRWMVAFGTCIIAFSLYIMGGFNLAVDFRTVVYTRMIQGLGLAFIFVPINTMAYAYVRKQDRNGASSLISLARNIGSSVGIAVVTTFIARGSQAQQATLSARLTPYDPAYAAALASTTRLVRSRSPDPAHAPVVAQARIAALVSAQARTLTFVNEFRYLALGILIMIPLVAMMKRPAPGAAPPPAH